MEQHNMQSVLYSVRSAFIGTFGFVI